MGYLFVGYPEPVVLLNRFYLHTNYFSLIMTCPRLTDVVFSALLLKISNKKQEFGRRFLRFCGGFYRQGTYTPSESIAYLWGVSLITFLFILSFFCAYPCLAGDKIAPDRNISVVLVEPEVPEWKYLWDKARNFVKLDDYTNASKMYGLLFQIKPNIEEASWEYCKVLLELKDSSAAKIIAALLEQSPNRNEYLVAGGLLAYRDKDFGTAASLYGKAFENNPYGSESDIALEGFVNSLRKSGKRDVAFPLLEQLYQRKPIDVHLLQMIALDARYLKKYRKAASLFDRLLQNPGTADRIIFQAAEVYESAGMVEKSVDLWTEYLLRHPDYIPFHHKLAIYYREREEFSLAVVHLSYLALNLAENKEYLLKTADMYLHELGRPDKALLFYEKYIEKHPESLLVKQSIANIQSILANDFLSIVENDGAWLLWRDLARVTPNRQAIYLEMAALLEKKGMHKELIDILIIIYHHTPKDEAMALRIARQYAVVKKYTQALIYLGKIQQNKSKDFFVFKGDIEFETGMEKEALQSYENALSRDPLDNELRYNCIKIAGSIGSVTKLKTFFEGGFSNENVKQSKKLLFLYLEQLKKNFMFQRYQVITDRFIDVFADDPEMVARLLLSLADAKQREGKFGKAEQILRKLLNNTLVSREALFKLAGNALNARNIDNASVWYYALEKNILKGSSLFPYSVEGGRLLVLKVRLLKLQGKYNLAIEIINEYFHSLNTTVESEAMQTVVSALANELCWISLYKGDYSAAQKLVLSYSGTLRFDRELLVLQKILDGKLKTTVYEKIAGRQLIAGRQSLVSRLLLVAESELLYQEYEAAAKHLEIVIKNVPDSLAGNILLARVFFAQGKFKEASSILSFLSGVFPYESYLYALLIEIEIRQGRYDKGLLILTGNSRGTDSAGNVLEKLTVGSDTKGKLLLARLLWGNNQHERCLEIYRELLAPTVLDQLSQDFYKKRINYLSLTQKETFWSSLLQLVQSEPDVVTALMGPDFLLDNMGNETGKIVASHFELYGWQKIISAEYLARKAIFDRNYIYAEQSYKRLLDEENSTEGMIDLAQIYGRFGKYRKEAQVYKELTDTGTVSPELTDSIESNSLLISPRNSVDTVFNQQFGRDGHIDMAKFSAGTSFWFTPELNKDFTLTYFNNQYNSKDTKEKAGSNLFNGSVIYEFSRDYEMILGAGVDTVNGDKNATILYSAELKGQLDEYVGAYLKGEKTLIYDTVQAVKEQIFAQDVSVGLNYETPFGLTFGGDFRHREYSDGNSQNKFHGFSSINYFYDFIYLSVQYDYKYMRSEEQNSTESSIPDIVSTRDDLNYWSPLSFNEQSLMLHFQHNFPGFQSAGKRGTSYYSIDNKVGCEDSETFYYQTDLNIFLEMSPHFLLKSNFTFSQSDIFEERSLALSFLYRW